MGLNMNYSREQQQIIRIFAQGKSVFFTGSAGTGKSVLLREIVRMAKDKYKGEYGRVAVTATTGIAACNVGGTTIHSFSGLGISTGNFNDILKRVRSNDIARARWMRTRVLIIDEISMLDPDLFDTLVAIARVIRKSTSGMGGIQVVACGDFFQLPPIPAPGQTVKYAFEAKYWTEVVNHTFVLSHVFRQRDVVFAGMLNEMRKGEMTPETIAKFQSLNRKVDWGDGLQPTELFATRRDVASANSRRLNAIPGAPTNYRAVDGGNLQDQRRREALLDALMAPWELQLKVDAQVMLIKNVNETLVNGTLGIVVAFRTEAEHIVLGHSPDTMTSVSAPGRGKDVRQFPVVRFTIFNARTGTTYQREMLVLPEQWKVEGQGQTRETLVSRTQVPLILAWAMSIHKSQGQTLERVRVNLRNVFERGQTYVAISRATCLEGLEVLHFEPSKVRVDPTVVEWAKGLQSANAIPEQTFVTDTKGKGKAREV